MYCVFYGAVNVTLVTLHVSAICVIIMTDIIEAVYVSHYGNTNNW